MLNTYNDLQNEIKIWCDYYAISYSSIETLIDRLSPYLKSYAELAVCEKFFEIITTGSDTKSAQDLAAIAFTKGLPAIAVQHFLKCHQQFPEAVIGLKLCLNVSDHPPTLYVRVKTDFQNGLNFLNQLNFQPQILESFFQKIKSSSTLYGLGFSSHAEQLLIKTYHLQRKDNGKTIFVSYRLSESKILEEKKEYDPNPILPLCSSTLEKNQLLDFAKFTLGYETIEHDSLRTKAEEASERKLYFERIGGIPTDFSAL